eukprot:1308226-Prymnesium_polylepis.1
MALHLMARSRHMHSGTSRCCAIVRRACSLMSFPANSRSVSDALPLMICMSSRESIELLFRLS